MSRSTLACGVAVAAFFALRGTAATAATAAQDAAPAPAPAAAAFDPNGSDAAAIDLVKQMWDSMGGKAAWDAVAVLSFDAVVESDGKAVRRTSWIWERATDRFRMEMKTKRGTLVALIDRKEKRGVVLENGDKVAESDHDAVLGAAMGFLEFDLNGLILPWRLMDPGVHLKNLEAVDVAGRKQPRVEVTFDAGREMPPGQKYVLTIEPVGHRLAALAITVAGSPADAEPMNFAWIDWADVGELQFCVDKEGLNVPNRLVAENVTTPAQVPEGTFEGL